jgi:hypothetical protein
MHPAILVAALAFVAATAGTALADPDASTSAVTKKKVKKIATKQVNKLAPGLSVKSASSATNAHNAAALDGVALEQLVPVAEGHAATCTTTLGEYTDCSPGAALTLGRRADVLVTVTAAYCSSAGAGVSFAGECRIQRNNAPISSISEIGSLADDTDLDQQRSLAMSALDRNRAPGTFEYELSCQNNLAGLDLTNVYVHAMALGS